MTQPTTYRLLTEAHAAANYAPLAAVQDIYAPAPLGGASHDDANILATITANPGKIVKLRPGVVYQIDSLQLPSNTRLDLNGSELRQVNPTGGSAGGACVRNATLSDTVTGNTNISIVNGTISVGMGASGRIVTFQGVTGLRLRNLQVQRRDDANFGDWMFYLRAIDDFTIDDFKITGGRNIGEDGLHVKSSTRGTISNGIIESGDDSLVFVHEFGVTRAMSDITVTNMVLRSSVANLVRVGVFAGETYPIHDITITGITADVPVGYPALPVTIHDDTNSGLVHDIVCTNWALDLTNQSNTNRAVGITNIRTSTFSNIRVSGGNGRGFDIEGSSDLTFTGCHMRQRATPSANSGFYITASQRLTFNQCTTNGVGFVGFHLDGGTGLADISFHQCTAINSGLVAMLLKGVAGVRVTNCFFTGTNGGISCDTGTPPSGLQLVANHVDAIYNPPVDTKASGNRGINDMGATAAAGGLYDPFTGTDGSALSSATWTPVINNRGSATAGTAAILANAARITTAPQQYAFVHLEGTGMTSQGDTDVILSMTPRIQFESYLFISINSTGDYNLNNGGNTATGSTLQVWIDPNAAAGKLTIQQNETALASATMTITKDTAYSLRFRRQGLALQAKLWTGATEPDAWNVTTRLAAPPAAGVISIAGWTASPTSAAAVFDVDYVLAG